MMEIYIKSEENKSQIISNTKIEESPSDKSITNDDNISQLLNKKIKRSCDYTHNQEMHMQINTIFHKEKNINKNVE